MVVGTFADVSGRRPAYLVCFIVYIGANIGCALAPNYVSLLILRMIQSAGSSTTVALVQGVVADLVTSAERGQYVGMAMVPIMLAPALGPVLGGIITQFLGWRWIFWILTILAAVVCLAMAFFMPETCRAIVGDGSIKPHLYYRTGYDLIKSALIKRRSDKARRLDPNNKALSPVQSAKTARHRLALPKPLTSLKILVEPEMFLLLLYSSIVGAGFYAVMTALSTQFSSIYGYSDLVVGLLYLPLAAGCLVASIFFGKLLNWNFQRHCGIQGIPYEASKQLDLADFPIERARLQITIPSLILTVAATATWGWIVQYRAPVAVPCVVLFILGVSMIGMGNTTTALLIDLNHGRAAAATAANNITRCLVGAAASAAIQPMISAVGNGWAFVILAALFVGMSPMLIIIMTHGLKWRQWKAKKAKAKEGDAEAEQTHVPTHQEAQGVSPIKKHES